MRPHHRPGQSSLFALVALPLMLGAVVLVLLLVRQRDTTTELRNAAVAGALAAADELATDALLTDDPDHILPLFDTCRATAAGVGHRNLVEGKRLGIAPPEGEKPGDLLFGSHDPDGGSEGSFRPLPANPTPADLGGVNAVRLTARHPFRDDVFTRVTAVFDRNVVGFRPLPDRPAPLVPVALYDGPRDDDRPTWSHALATGPDEWASTAGTPAYQPGRDGLREVTVRVGWQKQPSAGVVCGFPVRLAAATPGQAVKQVAGGVSAADLAHGGGEVKLNDEGRLAVPGDPDLFQPEDDDDRPLLHFRLLAQSGDVRVWPVFSRLAEDGTAVVVGFTAARVVAAVREADTKAIRLTLQPAVVATPTALTHPHRPAHDRSVGRVRIAG